MQLRVKYKSCKLTVMLPLITLSLHPPSLLSFLSHTSLSFHQPLARRLFPSHFPVRPYDYSRTALLTPGGGFTQ